MTAIIFRNETVTLISHDCHSCWHLTLANGIPLRKAMVMAGENVANGVDEEVYVKDGVEGHEAQEASSGDRRALADADQAGQLDISGETKTARILRTPKMAHNATHVPFRDWCPFCVASRGRSSPHRRVVVNKTVDTLPKLQTDFMFIRTVAESRTQPCITFVETRNGVVISCMRARKGGYEDLTKEILQNFEAYGFLNPVILQCDKEMSNIYVCRKVARERKARTVSCTSIPLALLMPPFATSTWFPSIFDLRGVRGRINDRKSKIDWTHAAHAAYRVHTRLVREHGAHADLWHARGSWQGGEGKRRRWEEEVEEGWRSSGLSEESGGHRDSCRDYEGGSASCWASSAQPVRRSGRCSSNPVSMREAWLVGGGRGSALPRTWNRSFPIADWCRAGEGARFPCSRLSQCKTFHAVAMAAAISKGRECTTTRSAFLQRDQS